MNSKGFHFYDLKKNLSWRILDSYILKKSLQSFFLSIALLMSIVIVIDISENIQRFIDNNVPLWTIITGYYFNFIPYFINLFIPLFTFISVIWFTSRLSNRNEIVAMLSNGVNFYRMMYPYVISGLIIAVFAFLMANFIVPTTNANLNKFKQEYFRKRGGSTTHIHLKNSANSYIYVERWEKFNKKGYSFTYEELSKDVTTYKISADHFSYDVENEVWILENYMTRSIRDGKETITRGARMDTIFNITDLNLNKDVTVIGTMTFSQLQRYIKEEKANGSSFVKYYLIERYKRMATPLGTIIMTLLGLSVASRKTHRGIGVHLFIGVALAFIFIFFQQVSDVFSVSGNLSPALGAWIPNLIFLFICIGMLRFTQK